MQQRTSLTLSPDRREAAVCGTAGFPCGAYFIDIALYPASAISWHWREEIELHTTCPQDTLRLIDYMTYGYSGSLEKKSA